MGFIFSFIVAAFVVVMVWSVTSAENVIHTNNSSDVDLQRKTIFENTTDRDMFTEMPKDPIQNNAYTTSGDVFGKRNIYDPNDYLEKFSTPIAAVVGIIGNPATIIALQGHPFNIIPSSRILVSLALSDSLTLICIQFNKQFVMRLVGYDVRAISREGCKIFNFALRFAKILSAWFVTLICLERFVAICFPFRIKLISTKVNALKGIAIVVFVAILYCGIWTLSSEIDQSQCHPSFRTPETAFRGKVLIIVGSIILGILPMIILVVLTPIMCFILFRQRKARRHLSSTQAPDVTKISSMLISLCVTYSILQLPLIVGHNLASALDENLYTSDYLPLFLLNKIGTILEAINYSCNFFLYIVCNHVFRRKVSGFFLCCVKNRRERIGTFITHHS